MSVYDVNPISNRLSLREPQKISLSILDRICEITDLSKDCDIAKALEVIKSEFPTVSDFERKFPSLCFALATGVGKTRLMGAFIAYLHTVHGVNNFFVVAPNLTIYNKLQADFTPNTPKYVFKGIGEFARNPPIIVTGDNYESGIGARDDMISNVVINIFNIAKITARDGGKLAKDDEQRSVARIRRLNEAIGDSYFNYLAEKEDLVVIMDESHRYRASAGWEALNDLKPVLGLELTATPQVEKAGKSVPFKNVIYDYPLALAIRDGYVKEPAVATRENFDPKQYSSEELEKIKLHDAVCIHESTAAALTVYAQNKGVKRVKPFILVVATDTTHSAQLRAYMESSDFFDGRYAGKILEINSATSGEEKDENIAKLLTVEDSDNPIEIVIHVNMLKEGWDVTNLYTIVPLRAANSKTLVEQSIGRGLRLPYGRRTGEPEVDTLTIVSHDKFQEIVDYANSPDSLIRKTVVIGRDIPPEGKVSITVKNAIDAIIEGDVNEPSDDDTEVSRGDSQDSIIKSAAKKYTFNTEEEKKIAKITREVISEDFQSQPTVKALSTPEIKALIVEKVKEKISRGVPQTELDFGGQNEQLHLEENVGKAIGMTQEMTIDIPRVIIIPKGESRRTFEMFNLECEGLRKFQRVSRDITVRQLQTNIGFVISAEEMDGEESPEQIIVSALMDLNDIPYDDNNAVINAIAKQYADFLRSYESDENEVRKIVLFNRTEIANTLHDELFKHVKTAAVEYKADVFRGFNIVSSNSYTLTKGDNRQNFRNPVFTKRDIGDIIFDGFKKCLFPQMKFDSDTERRFAVILEDSPEVSRWFKPTTKDISIYYSDGREYEPDFIVETPTCKLLVETKAGKDVDSAQVQAKAQAAIRWCEYASEHAVKNGGVPWKYLLIPDTAVLSNATLEGLVAKFAK